MGGGLGIVYGIADIEGLFKISIKLLYKETLNEIVSLAPVGLLVGICFGFFFGLVRSLELHFRGELPNEKAAREKKNSGSKN